MRGALVRIATVVLLILVGSIPLSGMNNIFAQETEIPDWVKNTLVLWSDGEITNEEFVTAIDYLSDKGIVKLSSTSEKEIQRQVEYLKAKAEVLKEETKQLREENEEYRILLKSQDINRGGNLPSSVSKLFDEYQALQVEIKSLREINKQFSKQIDSWIDSNGIPEGPIPSDIQNKNLQNLQSDYVNQINDLKQKNNDYQNKMKSLQDEADTYKRNIELLKLENQNKMGLIDILKSRNQESRDNLNLLVQDTEAYENTIAQLRNESFIQKQKIVEYENKIKSLGDTFKVAQDENTEFEQKMSILQKQNANYENTINELQGLNQEQKEQLISVANDLTSARNHADSLSEQLQAHESTIKSLKDESKVYQNKIKQVESEKQEFRDKISQLEQENIEQRKTIIEIMNDAQESNDFATTLNSRLSSYQQVIDRLENENEQYKSRIHELEGENLEKNTSLISMKNDIDRLNELVTNLNSKIGNYQDTIQKLEAENTQNNKDIKILNNEKSQEYEKLIRNLQSTSNEKDKAITEIKLELEESNNLISSLNSQIVEYESAINSLEKENSQFRNDISLLKTENKNYQSSSKVKQDTNENDELIQILSKEINQYEGIVQELKDENKLLEKKAGLASSENADKMILITEIESENREMRKQVELLQDDLKKKHEQINTLTNINEQKDAKISSLQAQKSQVLEKPEPIREFDNTKENDNLLVELNYLKAKSLVNEEEIEILRAENEEYRVLLNLLKKGQNSITGIDNTDYNSINDDGQGVVVYRTSDTEKNLPDDWVKRVDNSEPYTVYIEPSPKWSKDYTNEVHDALKFWSDNAGVEFEISEVPSFETTSIGWEKEMRNGYDGYVVGQTDVTVGLGSSKCDNSWKPYSSESIRDILIHELGHTVGLDHAISKSNIMYPMIHDARFDSIKQTVTIPNDGSVFIKGCSFNADPSYNYQVEVQDSKKVDIFFVPSIDEKYKVDAGESFDYYSDINCLGLQKSSKSGTCTIADSGGILVVNSGNSGSVVADIYLEEK